MTMATTTAMSTAKTAITRHMSTALAEDNTQDKAKDKDWDTYYQRTLDIPTPLRVKPFLDKIPQGGTVLDFGCGSGRFAAAFHRDRPDLSLHVLDINLAKAPLLQNADWVHKQFPIAFAEFKEQNAYDGIFAWASLFFEENTRHQPMFNSLAAAMKPGATLAFTFVESGYEKEGFPFHGRKYEELENLIKAAGLTTQTLEYRNDIAYGKTKEIIPTFIIHAQKI